MAPRHPARVAQIAARLSRRTDQILVPCAAYTGQRRSGLEAAAHATALGKALLATMDGRTRQCVLAEQGMRPFTRSTPVDPGQVEHELVRLRPGDLVTEHGQFREDVCCAGVAIPGPGRDSWWALGASARGLPLPAAFLTELRLAATDLADAAASRDLPAG